MRAVRVYPGSGLSPIARRDGWKLAWRGFTHGMPGAWVRCHMNMQTILIILVIVLLLGGGGFYYRGRR